MEITNEYIDELIALYLAGEANAEQELAMQQWLAASETNAMYFKQVKTIFDSSPQAKKLQEFDADKAWAAVQQKIHAPQKNKGKLISLFRKSELLKVAAVFLAFISLTYLLNAYYKNNNANQVSVKSETRAIEKILADGSRIHLNKKTQLKYNNDFNKTNRKVSLSGEAFFEVQHDAKKPFTVVLDDLFIEDIGTSFNVKAYPNSPSIDVAVVSGIVKFYSENNQGIELHAGEEGSYDKNKKSFSSKAIKDKNISAYKDKIFVFENAELHTVVAMLGDIYNCNIVLSNPQLARCQLTVTFENESIDKVLDIIATTFNLKVVKNGSTIVLTGESCGN